MKKFCITSIELHLVIMNEASIRMPQAVFMLHPTFVPNGCDFIRAFQTSGPLPVHVAVLE